MVENLIKRVASFTNIPFVAVKTARYLVTPKPRQERLAILAATKQDDQMFVTLPANSATLAPGHYSLWFNTGTAHARIGDISSVDSAENAVTRLVLAVEGGRLEDAHRGRWSGIVFNTPEASALDSEDVQISTDGGQASAWIIKTDHNHDNTWAIHIHGLGSTRAGTLRGTPIAHKLGLTSLIPSYRNDPDAPKSIDQRSHLGADEWRDIEASMVYAHARGAQQFILFGWSLGATIAKQLCHQSSLAPLITGLVLIAPVLSWKNTLTHHLKQSAHSRATAALTLRILKGPMTRRLAGLSAPIKIEEPDTPWQPAVPTLVIHSRADRSAPYVDSKKLHESSPELVSLETFDESIHTLEWNTNPARWEKAVEDWYSKISSDDDRQP